jgi:hypothetical protein
VLIAIAARFMGSNNGDLSLTVKDARELGVAHPWKLYAGLSLLKKADLIVCTRQGHLAKGKKLCNLFALTWLGINARPDGTSYDAGISVCPLPSHAWAKWEMPADWKQTIREVSRANHGNEKAALKLKRFLAERATEPVSTTLGNDRSTTLGNVDTETDQPRWVKEVAVSDQHVVDTSKNLVGDPQHVTNTDPPSEKRSTDKPMRQIKTQRRKTRHDGATGNTIHRSPTASIN